MDKQGEILTDLSNFFRICVYFCLVCIVFTLCVNFVSGLGIFPTVSGGEDVDLSTTDITGTEIFDMLTPFDGGMQYIWLLFTSLTGITAFILARAFGTTTIIGVWLFGEIFWTSYANALGVLDVVSLINWEFVVLFTSALCFVFIGAIISMFTNVS